MQGASLGRVPLAAAPDGRVVGGQVEWARAAVLQPLQAGCQLSRSPWPIKGPMNHPLPALEGKESHAAASSGADGAPPGDTSG